MDEFNNEPQKEDEDDIEDYENEEEGYKNDNEVKYNYPNQYPEYFNEEKNNIINQNINPINQLSNTNNISNQKQIQNPNRIILNSSNNNNYNKIQRQYNNSNFNFPNPNQNDIRRNDIYYQNNLNLNYPINKIYQENPNRISSNNNAFNNQNQFLDNNNIRNYYNYDNRNANINYPNPNNDIIGNNSFYQNNLNENYNLQNQDRNQIQLENQNRIFPNLNMIKNQNEIRNYNNIQNPFQNYSMNTKNYQLNQSNQNYPQNQLLNQNYNIDNNNISQNLPHNYQPQFGNDINSYLDNSKIVNAINAILTFLYNNPNINFNNNNINNNKLCQDTLKINNDNLALTSSKKLYSKDLEEKERRNRIMRIYKKNKRSINKKIENNENDIIIYIDNNNNDIEFINGLNKIKAIKLKDLELPKNINEQIFNKAKENKYKITEEDYKMLSCNYNNKEQVILNNYMFYSTNEISLYPSHIIKAKNNIISIFFTEEQRKLNEKDFQYYHTHNYINNDIFLNLLKKRISEYNNFKKENENIIDKNYDEKIFGFNLNSKKNNYYLYTIMDEDIIKKKLLEDNVRNLKQELVGSLSKIGEFENQSICTNNRPYEQFNKNMNFLKGLTYEELILYIILERLEKKYEILPRIIFYEYYLTIKGEKVIISDKIEKGYSELDYVLYSKTNYKYDNESPLISQKRYTNEKSNIYENFELKENILYFFELKSSLYLFDNKTFNGLLNKCKEFAYLYESRGWIDKKTKKEIILIYDSELTDKIINEYENKIKEFIQNNKGFSFSLVYSISSFSFFSHNLAINKYLEVKSQIEENEKKYEEKFKENEKKNEENEKKMKYYLKN